MIDTAKEVTCKFCHKPIVQGPGGHRVRQYCNAAHKMRYRRAQQAEAHSTLEQQNIAALQEKLMRVGTEKERVERRVQVQRTRIGELEAEGSRLRKRVEDLLGEVRNAGARISELEVENRTLKTQLDQLRDIEKVFSKDTGMHSFKNWLRTHQYHAERAGCKKILDDAYGFPPAGSRGSYTDAIRQAGLSTSEQADVWDAWRDMLRDELFKSYYADKSKQS